jgi:TolB-like protein/Tfp pilus assembly protein PilF
MKKCPECHRDYNDDSLSFCLDDGAELLFGPSSLEEPATAILDDTSRLRDAATRTQILTTDQTSTTNSDLFSVRKYFTLRGLLALSTVAVVLVAGIFGYRYLASTKAGYINSIAVMPFANASGNVDFEYLSDGITEVLIKNLSSIPNLNVKARSSVFRYKGQQPEIKKVASELGVQALLSGRVAQLGDEITLSLELIDTGTENVIWSEQYVRKQADLAKLQNEIARDVSNKLKAKLSAAEQNKLNQAYTADPQAYQLYLKGQFLLNKATQESQKQGAEYFRQAIDIDPNFAEAYSSMADAYTILGTTFNAQMSTDEAMRNARAAAEKALQLDPNLSKAYTSLAWIEFRFDWNWEAAETNFKKSIELDPKNAHAHQWFGEFLASMRRYDESIAEHRTAGDLEPFSVIITWNLGKALFDAHRDDEAIAALNKSLEIDNNFPRTYRFLSVLYEEKGMMKDAFEAFLKQPEIASLPPDQLAELRTIFETKGIAAARRKGAERYLAVAATSAQKAVGYAALGEKQLALDWLEKACDERSGTLVGLNSDRLWDAVRNEPRFQDLIRRMNFPKSKP